MAQWKALWSAPKDELGVTVSVATDDKGRFISRRQGWSRAIQLSTRAVGYDLEGPKSAEILAGKTASVESNSRPRKI